MPVLSNLLTLSCDILMSTSRLDHKDMGSPRVKHAWGHSTEVIQLAPSVLIHVTSYSVPSYCLICRMSSLQSQRWNQDPEVTRNVPSVTQLMVSGTGIQAQAEQIFLIITTSCLTRLLKQLGIRIDTRVAESTFWFRSVSTRCSAEEQ